MFAKQHLLPELSSPQINENHILKADAIKFVTTFRSLLPKATLLAVFPHLIRLLGSEFNVVHSYAATAVERIGAALAAQTGMIGPMSTIALGVLILGEPLNAWIGVGTLLVLGGVFIVSRYGVK